MILRGVRNCNPANIRKGSKWKGMRTEQHDKDFVQFITMDYGIRALIIVLRTYVTVHGLHSIRSIISRWAPPSDHNHTEKYINYVQQVLKANCPIVEKGLHLSDFCPASSDYLYWLCYAMCWMESGYVLERADFDRVMRVMI